MRKWISMLLVLALTAALAPAGLADAVREKGTDAVPKSVETAEGIVKKETTMYVGSMDAWVDVSLYFMDGAEDLPWMELSEFADFYTRLRNSYDSDPDFKLIFSAKGEVATLERETGYYMEVDCDKDTIYFSDYDAFLHDNKASVLLDLVAEPGYSEDGQQQLIQRIDGTSYDRYGIEIELPLKDYEIDLIHKGDGYYVPMQTLSDFLVAPYFNSFLLYNGKAAFLGNGEKLGSRGYGLTPMGEYYYSVEPRPRSEALAKYGYCELCLMLDNLYGLKEIHDIDNFSQLFYQLGYEEDLLDTDALTADAAVSDIINLQLDDIHSDFASYSPYAKEPETESGYGLARQKNDDDEGFYKSVRARYYPNGCPFYEEVGNTAYITFDTFESDYYGNAYYDALENNEDIPEDTIGSIMLAHQMIYRNGSPVENVVIDLSCNTGGAVDAAVFVVGWILGEATLAVKNTFTGAQSTARYRVDVNLDRLFNSGDEVDDKNVYCLISPVSFSCGNLVPWAFKASRRVRLLGSTSGGGSCTVQPMSTAWGSYFNMSGPTRMSFQKNGSFYDIDKGVDPDFSIDKVTNYYDREALTAYINGLF